MKIKLHPIGQELPGDPNKTVLQICFENKFELKSLCKGVPSCAECRVKVLAGESNLIPPTKAELSLIGTSYYLDGRRLACQLRAFGDVSLDVTEHLNKDDNANKKVRGYRQPGKQFESKAVQGTMMLEQPTATTSSGSGGERDDQVDPIEDALGEGQRGNQNRGGGRDGRNQNRGGNRSQGGGQRRDGSGGGGQGQQGRGDHRQGHGQNNRNSRNNQGQRGNQNNSDTRNARPEGKAQAPTEPRRNDE